MPTTPLPRTKVGRPPLDTVKISEVNNRFIQFRTKYVDETQRTAAKKLGIVQSSMSKIESGKLALTMEIIETLTKDYNLNPDWLFHGAGPMIVKAADKKKDLVTDMVGLQQELSLLRQLLQFMEANQKYMAKVLGETQQELAKVKQKVADMEARKG